MDACKGFGAFNNAVLKQKLLQLGLWNKLILEKREAQLLSSNKQSTLQIFLKQAQFVWYIGRLQLELWNWTIKHSTFDIMC